MTTRFLALLSSRSADWRASQAVDLPIDDETKCVDPEVPMRRAHHPWSGLLYLALTCVLISSRWLIENWLPSAASTSTTQAGALCITAVWFFSLGRWSGSPRREPAKARPQVISGLGFCLALSGGLIGRWIFGHHLSSSASTLALALTPVIALVARAAGDADGDVAVTERLWPMLASLGGMLLLLTPPSHLSFREWIGLLMIPVLTGIGAELASRESLAATASGLRGQNWAAAGGCLVPAVLFRAQATTSSPQFSLIASCLDAVTMTLGLLALQRLGSVRWSAQFLLSPLLVFLEGLAFLRPTVDLRTVLGLALLAVGSLRLLLPQPGRREPGLGLRGPNPDASA